MSKLFKIDDCTKEQLMDLLKEDYNSDLISEINTVCDIYLKKASMYPDDIAAFKRIHNELNNLSENDKSLINNSIKYHYLRLSRNPDLTIFEYLTEAILTRYYMKLPNAKSKRPKSAIKLSRLECLRSLSITFKTHLKKPVTKSKGSLFHQFIEIIFSDPLMEPFENNSIKEDMRSLKNL